MLNYVTEKVPALWAGPKGCTTKNIFQQRSDLGSIGNDVRDRIVLGGHRLFLYSWRKPLEIPLSTGKVIDLCRHLSASPLALSILNFLPEPWRENYGTGTSRQVL